MQINLQLRFLLLAKNILDFEIKIASIDPYLKNIDYIETKHLAYTKH